MASLLTKIFGSRNDRLIKQYRRKVAAINKLEPEMKALSDEQLKAKTAEFRQRLADGASLDSLLPEAFAVVREASFRVLGMRHFDVQLIGGMVLNDGKIAEMRTGEGKTLTATLAVYLNALPGKGAHVVTVNDYLASRDAAWMGKVYNFLGMSVGTILSNQPNDQKQAAYAADITYGTNNEFGFDYLRDNMEYETGARRQRGLFFAIVDEVDSILIDEARTPLIFPALPKAARIFTLRSTRSPTCWFARNRKRAKATTGLMKSSTPFSFLKPATRKSKKSWSTWVCCLPAKAFILRRTSCCFTI